MKRKVTAAIPAVKTTRSTRDARLDAVRGAAIIGVVLGHVLRGMMSAGMIEPYEGIGLVNERVIYLIRLPLFVLISGLLMSTSVERRGTKDYLIARLTDLGWVYLLWTLLQGSVEVATSPLKNTPTTWSQVLNLWEPMAQLWYLPFLMAVSIGVVLVKPWRGGWRLALGTLLALAVSIALWGRDGTTVLTRGMSLTVFVVAGAAITRERVFRWWDASSSWLLLVFGAGGLAGAAWIGLQTAAIMPTSDRLIPWSLPAVLLGVAGSVLGVVGAACAVVLLGRWFAPAERLLSFLGRHAMAIYLGHITLMAGARIVLLSLGVTSVPVHVVIGTLVGTLGSLLIVWAARYIPWLLQSPRRVSRKA